MEIKEFFYVNSKGQTIGPIAFNAQNIGLITLETYVWHPGITDGWKKARMVPEFVSLIESVSRPSTVVPPPFVSPDQTPGSAQKSSGKKDTPIHPNKVASSNQGQDSGQKRNARIILLVITIVGAMIAAAISFIFIAPIASMFNTKPLTVAFVIGGAVYLIAMAFRLLLRKNKGFGWLPLCGLIVGVVFPLIAYARFDDWGTYKNGILIGKNVYNSWGAEIYSGRWGVNRVNGPSGMKILVVNRSEQGDGYIYTASGYDENGNMLFNETTPVLYGSIYDLDKEYVAYLRQEEGIFLDELSLNVNRY